MNKLKKILCRHRVKHCVASFDTEIAPGHSQTMLVIVCDNCEKSFIRKRSMTLQEADKITKEYLLPKLREEVEQRNALIDLLQRKKNADPNNYPDNGSYIDIPSHYGNN